MKLSKLLVLGACCLTATSSMAEIVNGVRQRPAVTQFESFQVDQVYYLYNVQARRFFVGANDYNTRASVASNGYKVKFVDPGDAAPEAGLLEFTDSVETQKAWKSTFATNDGGAIWVDNATETYRFWDITPSNGGYRISNSLLEKSGTADAIVGKFLGWNGSEGDTRLYFVDPAAEGAGVDWQFVSIETYDAYQENWAAIKDQFEKAAELKIYLDAAKEQGVDVSEEQAIYENEAATIEELDAAILAVQKKINEHIAGNASVDNPSDMTGSMLNPNFDNASYEGWKGTAPNMVGSGAHGPANVAEHYNKTFDTYQDLANMPKGVYKLSATSFFRGSWSDHVNHTNYVAYLYGKADNDTLTAEIPNPWDAMNTVPMAGSTEWGVTAAERSEEHDGVTYYIPNDPSAGRLYFEQGYYGTNVFFALDGDEPIRVGVMKKSSVTGSDWVVFDNFKLTYYGNAADAYQYWIGQTPKNDYSETQASQQYKDAYEAAFNATASNKPEAVAVMKAIQAAADSITANVNLWAELKKTFSSAEAHTVGDYARYISAQDLSDYLLEIEDDVRDVVDWSNTEIRAILAKLNELIDAVEKEDKESLEPGKDVTDYMKNPGFEENGGSTTGWTIVSKGGGNVQLGGNSANHCFEAWHSTNFDVYQELKDLPLGVYELTVQGYVRYKDGSEAIAARSEVPENIPIYVYVNDSKTNMANWFDYPKPISFYQEVSGATYLSEDDDNAYPDNQTAASAAFADGGYKKSAFGLVAQSGDVLRVGVKGNPTEAMFWPCFDNFTLTYRGYAADVVKPVLEETVASAQALVNEMTTKQAKADFDAALAEATAQLSGTDGTEMFRALSSLMKAISAVEAGAVLCKELNAAVEQMMTLAQEGGSAAAAQALQLGAEIQGKLEGNELEAEEIEAYKLQIREMMLKMQLPENYEKGEGADVTAFIQTPSFQKTVDGVETNSIEGWEGTAGYNFGNDDTQRSALALEFYEKTFDMYQDIEGVGSIVLPDGAYTVTVNAFERVSDNTPAYLYAKSGDNEASVELIKLTEGVDTEAGEVAPNDMVSAVAAFEEGKYLNQVNVNVVGGKLRIGIKHENNSGSDWIIMDNFKLYFNGADESGIQGVAQNAKPVSVQYFTIDGRRVSGAQKGISIRKTVMDNGSVVVKKVRK